MFRVEEKTLDKVGLQLLKKIIDIEGRLSDVKDDLVADWEKGNGDVEKIELQERIHDLEEQQVKILARYEQMHHTLSAVSEQVFRMKQKLRYNKSEAISNMVKTLTTETTPIPEEIDLIKEMAVALKIENKVLSAKVPRDPKDEIVENQAANEPSNRRQLGKSGVPGRDGGAGAGGGMVIGSEHLVKEGDIIIAGTKPKLMGALLAKANPDQNFTVDFLCVYPCFMSGSVLLQNIIQRYTSSQDKSQQLRIFNIMKTWINCNYIDFRDDASLHEAVTQFIPTMADVVTEKQSQMLLSILEKKISAVESEPKNYLIPKKEWNLLKLDSADIARQMTLHDSKLYRLIDPRVGIKSPDDLLLTKRIKKVELWVEKEMRKSKKKSLTIKKFVDVSMSMGNEWGVLCMGVYRNGLFIFVFFVFHFI
jgi:hypothetical protein